MPFKTNDNRDYLFQQLNGHSQQIADRFHQRSPDSSANFRGTWKIQPSLQQVGILKQLLQLKLVGQCGTITERDAARREIDNIIHRIYGILHRSNNAPEAGHLLENAIYAIEDSSSTASEITQMYLIKGLLSRGL